MPDITFNCTNCGQHLSSPEEGCGLVAACPTCGAAITIPPPTSAESTGLEAPETLPSPAPDYVVPSCAQPGLRERFGLGDVFRWTGEGMALGFRHVLRLTGANLLLAVLVVGSTMLCVLPGLFVGPGMAAGFTLMLLAITRQESDYMGQLFRGFSGGIYWPSVGLVLLLGCIFAGLNTVLGYVGMVLGLGGMLAMMASDSPFGGLVLLALALTLLWAPTTFLSSRLIWALPLVVERRASCGEALGLSWKLTGRVAGGFGMFVLLLVLSTVGTCGTILTFGGASAAFGTSFLAQNSEVARRTMVIAKTEKEIVRRSGESEEAFEIRRLQELHRRLGIPLPTRQPAENNAAYLRRLSDSFQNRALQKPLDNVAVDVIKSGWTSLALAAVIVGVLGAALGGILALPIIVAYREVVSQAGLGGAQTLSPREPAAGMS